MRTMEEALIRYEANLTPESGAAAYLYERGFEQTDALTNRLGVVGDDCLPEHRGNIGRLAIPYLALDGRPVQIRFRCFKNHDHDEYGHGKYMTMEGDPARIYGVQEIVLADAEIHVTEGEFDAMILRKIGLHAVAIPGANGFQGRHKRMLAGFGSIYVWGDPDEAGMKFTREVTSALSRAVGVRLEGMDVNDTYMHEGEAALYAALAEVQYNK